ncbi:7363_t:CDS:1, partial [Funneliformis mosseae]
SDKLHKDNANKWIENALNSKEVKFIPFNQLINSKNLTTGGFGSIMKATWITTGTCIVYKRLTNTQSIKGSILDAFIHELKIHLHFDFCDRIVRCFGISK